MSQTVTLSQAVDAVKASLDIVSVVSSVVTLRKAGRNYSGLCPFHKEKTPSFSVNREKNLFKCFGCGESGDALTFLMKTRGKTFVEVIREEAERQGLSLASEHGGSGPSLKPEQKDRLLMLVGSAADWFASQMNTDILGYLKQRGFDAETVRRFGLGYAPAGWDSLRKTLGQHYPDVTDKELSEAGLCVLREDRPGSYDRFRNRLMFAIHNEQGQVVGFGGRSLDANDMPKYLNSSETPVYVKSRLLYGLYWAKPVIKERRRAIVMEGYFDVIRAHQAGFTEAVATCGTALTKEHVTLLLRSGVDTLYLAFDSDAAGQRAILSALDVLDGLSTATDLKVRVVQLPNGKDPDEYLQHQPPETFETILQEAMPHWQFRCDAAMAGLDLTTDDGRNQALNNLVAVLSTLDPVKVRNVGQHYANRLNIKLTELLDYLSQQKKRKHKTSKAPVTSILSRELQKSEVLLRRYKHAERTFFFHLLETEVGYEHLKPYVAAFNCISAEAKELKRIIEWLLPDAPLQDIIREIERNTRENDALRSFWIGVQLSDVIMPYRPTERSLSDMFAMLNRECKIIERHLKALASVINMYRLEGLDLDVELKESLALIDFLRPLNEPFDLNSPYSNPLEAQYAFKDALDERWALLRNDTGA